VTATYLVGCAIVFTLGYGLPLALFPLAWARRFGWKVHDDPLTVYLGRCLGCVILAVSAAAVRAAWRPANRTLLLELLVVAFAAMTIVHVVGWLRRTQPVLETLEIPGYLVLASVAVWLRLSGA